jgi:hypothetical protein
MNNYRWTLGGLLLVLSVCFAFSGCVSGKAKPRQFNDIPVPRAFNLVDCISVKGMSFRAGQWTFKGAASVNSVFTFYYTEMPRNEWVVTSVSDKDATVEFQKLRKDMELIYGKAPVETCVVKVYKKDDATFVNINIK